MNGWQAGQHDDWHFPMAADWLNFFFGKSDQSNSAKRDSQAVIILDSTTLCWILGWTGAEISRHIFPPWRHRIDNLDHISARSHLALPKSRNPMKLVIKEQSSEVETAVGKMEFCPCILSFQVSEWNPLMEPESPDIQGHKAHQINSARGFRAWMLDSYYRKTRCSWERCNYNEPTDSLEVPLTFKDKWFVACLLLFV